MRTVIITAVTAVVVLSGCGGGGSKSNATSNSTDQSYPCDGCFCKPVFGEIEMQIHNDLEYGSARNHATGRQEKLLLNIYEPPKSDQRVLRPAIVVIHGGAFIMNSKDTGHFVHWAQNFVANGFVAVSINYRLSWGPSDAANTYAMEDARAAVRWLVKNSDRYRVDANRIAAFGASAGGMTTAYLCVVPGEGDSGNPGYASNITAGVSLSGFLYPEHYLDIKAEAPPYLDFHGDADPIVSYDYAVQTKRSMEIASMVNDLITFPGKKHVPFDTLEEHRSDIMGFLTKYMDLNGTECPTPTQVI